VQLVSSEERLQADSQVNVRVQMNDCLRPSREWFVFNGLASLGTVEGILLNEDKDCPVRFE